MFPRHAKVSGKPVSNRVAGAASRLHVLPFGALGRIRGLIQRARWTEGRPHPVAVTFTYVASVFRTPADAATAFADARASLWEHGGPLAVAGSPGSDFMLAGPHGRIQLHALLRRGPIEVELSLTWGGGKGAMYKGIQHLSRAARAASSRLRRLTGSAPPSSGATLFPFIAPQGTGPVVKSPSLMLFDAAALPSGARLDGPPVRHDGAPHLSGDALPGAPIVPAGGLARYVQTASRPDGTTWFDTAALYPDPASAARAYEQLLTTADHREGLEPSNLAASLPAARLDTARAWNGRGETVIALRAQNVVMALVQDGGPREELGSITARVLGTVPTWLHAQGTSIVDAAGAPVRLACLNWYGAEENDYVVGGLDMRPYGSILRLISALGYNCVRLPFSNQLVEQNPVITAHVGRNSKLRGLHALDVLDRIVAYAGALGLWVVLDNHRSEAGWSSQESGLWYTPAYPHAAFVRDWSTMARRYAGTNAVIGADLRNEPHGPATWGDGNPATDWRAAAQEAGDAVLAANPNILVIVEGVQFYGSAPSYWWGGNLMGVATVPVSLRFADGSDARSRLVYSTHDYGPDMCGGGCPWFKATATYQSLSQVWESYWGFITSNPEAPYAAPVWVGEFGTCNQAPRCTSDPTPGTQGQWFESLVRYIGEKQLSWAYWSLNGTQSTAPGRTYGDLDWYGVLGKNWATPIPWTHESLQRIL